MLVQHREESFFWFSEEKLEREKTPSCKGTVHRQASGVPVRGVPLPRGLEWAFTLLSDCCGEFIQDQTTGVAEAPQVSYIVGDSQTHPLVLSRLRKWADQ